jgi:Tol biopolymer transport system component/preprotein translocase subunit YajC
MRESVRILWWPLNRAGCLAAATIAGIGCGGEGLEPPTTGTLEIAVITTGTEPDADGYSVSIDGGGELPLGVNGTLEQDDLSPGDHAVLLGGVAGNCTLAGDNPRTVSVTAGRTETITFDIVCAATTGSLTVTSSTTGTSPDADGYTISLDGTDRGVLGASGEATLGAIAPGDHLVGLGGIAGNCQVAGENARTVSINAGATTTAAFVISCATPPAGSGTVHVTTVTTGASPDPDGYTFALDAGGTQTIGANATVSVTSVAPGEHTVTLSGIAANCQVQVTNPAPITLASSATVSVNFTVVCSATPGSLQVNTLTTGENPDPDGYTVTLDNGTAQPIGSTASLSLTDIAAGSHTVALAGMAANCSVSGENPRTITVTAGAPVVVDFTINCMGATTSRIAFISNTFGLGAIFTVNHDGTSLTRLTPEGVSDQSPVWSPDGRKVLFASGPALYTMNADGSNRARIAEGFDYFQYRWSPDGSRIAVVLTRMVGEDVFDDIWVMRSDGTGQVRVAENAMSPSWAPDGRSLVYSSVDLNDLQIHVVNIDGSGDRILSSSYAFQPAWSPDGTRIAFVTLGSKDIWLINPDGTGSVNLTPALTDDDSPVWSPDGSRLAFNTGPDGQPLESDVAVMNGDGSGRANLTNRPGFDYSPDWSPDGTKIVYQGSAQGDSEIYVMNADGSGHSNVSNRPDAGDGSPDWAGQGQLTASRVSKGYLALLRANGLRDIPGRTP